MVPARHPDHDAEHVRKRRKKDAIPRHDRDGDNAASNAGVAYDAKHHWPADDSADCSHKLHVAASHDPKKAKREEQPSRDCKPKDGILKPLQVIFY